MFHIESKQQTIGRVKKQRNEMIVRDWHKECDEAINDPTCGCVDIMKAMRPMYDYLLESGNEPKRV